MEKVLNLACGTADKACLLTVYRGVILYSERTIHKMYTCIIQVRTGKAEAYIDTPSEKVEIVVYTTVKDLLSHLNFRKLFENAGIVLHFGNLSCHSRFVR